MRVGWSLRGSVSGRNRSRSSSYRRPIRSLCAATSAANSARRNPSVHHSEGGGLTAASLEGFRVSRLRQRSSAANI